ncbi:MAG: hypothetical protein Tp172MES00d2C118482111_20 [Prokaryotic dsDNA virus sp.]|nr:MAG: hypothetical protein Tp172MES00d2C118482111_20 [Prokaryotic dsDNA virus sp.]|tara:strand:- start:1722 stop:2300 length:579 start_codon:yes stop_codon:yes gene_type:complete
MKTDATKEVAVVEDQVGKMSEAVAALPKVIESQEQYDETFEVGKKVALLLKNIDKGEKKITKPINDGLKRVRDIFRPFKTQVKTVSDDLKARRQEFINKEEAAKAKKEEQIEGRVERGTMREDTAVGKLAELEEGAPDARGGMTSVLKVKVTDIRLVPEEFLSVDETAIKKLYREGTETPGVECHYEKVARN